MALSVHITAKAERATHTPVVLNITNRIKSGPRFSSAIPGGFQACSFSVALPKAKAVQWYTQQHLMGVLISDGTEPQWEGRINSVRLTDSGVDVACEGYWASMADQTLVSWWADDALGNWKQPARGAGGISDDISLSGVGNSYKFNTELGAALLHFSLQTGRSYVSGDKAVVYYKLPRVASLSDKRIFQPMTIHAVQFTWEVGTSSLDFRLRVWTANWIKGTWVQRYNVDPFGQPQGTTNTVNLVPAADGDEGQTEAIAIGLECINNVSTLSEDYRWLVSNLTIFADRNPLGDGKPTPRKIITNLLNAASPLVANTHAQQVAPDLHMIERTDLEIIPAVFDKQTFQDIATRVAAFGVVEVQNLITNPSLELSGKCWTDDASASITPVADATFGFGAQAANMTTTNASGKGFLIWGSAPFGLVRGRFPVKSNQAYEFSVGLRLTAVGTNKTFNIQVHWYDAAGASISAVGALRTITDTATRYGSNMVTSPSNAASALLEVLTDVAQGVFTVRADGARFAEAIDEGTVDAYLDGGYSGYAWAGDPNDSQTVANYPALLGVFGQRRLHYRKRITDSLKWIIPLSAMLQGGSDLERQVQDSWSRVWAGFTQAFSGEVEYTDPVVSNLALALLSPERDTISGVGAVTESFAFAALKAFADEHNMPKQKTEVAIKGMVRNAYGGREPVWRVRAGDHVLIPDVVPLSLPQEQRVNTPASWLDRLKVFVVRETNYDAESGELRFVPDNYPDTLEIMLARISTTPSISAPGSVSTGSGELSTGGLNF